jgi:succinate dehydrogenase/fumarate reductase flavoprotein subunit
MDCRKVPETVLTKKYGELLRLLTRANLNPLKDLIPIAPAVHFSMGGVAINNRTETSVPGLLACGEAAGGLHGANRLAGNALPETFIFGMTAGRHAVNLLKTNVRPAPTRFDLAPFRPGNLSLAELRRDLRKITWNYLSIIRTRNSGKTAQAEIDRIADSLVDADCRSIQDLVSFYELNSMIATARLITQGSLAREESRGSHFRADHPKTDEESFKGSFFYRKEEGRLKMVFRPVGD